ncbi:MAG: tetratricopeptide repeat protein [Kofleriaceae bacterium]
MRLPVRSHASAFITLVMTLASASAQPGPPTDPFAPLPPPRGVVVVEGTAEGSSGPRPAGSSAVESSDVPDVKPSPPRFAVASFENRANVRPFDWYQWGAPFEIAGKVEDVLGLESTGGSLFVGPVPIRAEATAVAAFAKTNDATWVVTGWVERPNWELRIAVSVWKVDKGLATREHEAVRQGKVETYHALLGDALVEVWTVVGMKIDAQKATRLARPLASDLYATSLMARGLGHLVAAIAMPIATTDAIAQKARAKQFDLAKQDLERSVFIDPKCFEAQRLVGELYALLSKEQKDPKLANKAAGKFAYAHDLAPDDLQSLRAAAAASVRAGKAEVSLPLFEKLVTRRPWDLEARYQYGAALWQTGDAPRAEKQLELVTAKKADHLPSRRVLALIHASRSETQKLVKELEAIAARVPDDVDVKDDLATAYGALGDWARSTAQLEAIAATRAPDLALLVRIGDGYRRQGKLEPALAWYGRAQKIAPESSFAGFIAAQSLFDAGRLAEAARVYTGLQRYGEDRPSAEQALAVIALAQGKPSEAAWYLRRSTRTAPRDIRQWRALITAELGRRDAILARSELDRALPHWPDDGQLRYLSGITAALANDRAYARRELSAAIVALPDFVAARTALSLLDSGGTPQVAYSPELVELIRPWGDAEGLQRMIDHYAITSAAMATVRLAYQTQFLTILASLGRGPYAPVKVAPVRTCPVARVAPLWAAAQKELRRYERLGVELEATADFLARHAAIGGGAGLLPTARTQLANAKKTFRVALADITELRAEWSRGLAPELRVAGCNDKLLAAAVANPERYRVVVQDRPPEPPAIQPPRPRARATFYVDNSRCVDAVDVWIDGSQLGQVAPGRRSALVADAGEHTLCLLLPGSAQCGDRGTVRQIYLHDGWSVTMHCPK